MSVDLATWENTRLGDLGSVIRGVSYVPQIHTRARDDAGTVRLLRANNVQGGRVIHEDLIYVDESRVREDQFLRTGDVVICMANGSKDLVGKVARFDARSTYRYTFGAFMAALRPRSPTDAAFLAQLMQSSAYRRRIAVALAGSSINNLRPAEVEAFEFPMPGAPERSRVGAFLADSDAQLDVLDELVAKKRAIAVGVRQALLSGAKRLPGFTEPWQIRAIRDLGSMRKGAGISRGDVVGHGLPCLRYGELYTTYDNVVSQLRSRISPKTAESAGKLLTGDIAFAGSGETSEEIGKCVAYVGSEPAFVGGDTVILTPGGCDSAFLGYALNADAVVSQRARLGQGDAVVHISAANLGSIVVSVPTLQEQRAIAELLSDIDAEIDALVARRDKTALIKQGMMDELLTGRTRLV